MFYDRAGRPISYERYRELWSSMDYRVVRQEEVAGAGVSTVWLGIDHAVRGAPVIFETMIFGGEHDGVTWRYPTEMAARRGHMFIVIYLRISMRALPR